MANKQNRKQISKQNGTLPKRRQRTISAMPRRRNVPSIEARQIGILKDVHEAVDHLGKLIITGERVWNALYNA
jgi:hypothetical protein